MWSELMAASVREDKNLNTDMNLWKGNGSIDTQHDVFKSYMAASYVFQNV
jgi:hypothetical protein